MPREHNEQPEASVSNGNDFEHSRQRTTLYRVLAENIVRELREGGHTGHELLGFASAVMQAITDNAWDDRPGAEATRTEQPALPMNTELDPDGRPVLSGRRVLLRSPVEADRAALEQWTNDPLVRASLIPVVLQHVIDNLDELARDEGRLDLMVCDRATRTGIGLVSLHDIDRAVGQAELGKVIGDPAFRGKGAAQEATRLIVAHGFQALRLNRIYLRTRGGNLKNIRLNERMGFRFEGVLQQAVLTEGQLTDVVLMGMLRREFKPPPAG